MQNSTRLICTLLLLMAQPHAAAAERLLVLATWNIEHLAALDGRGCRPREAGEYQEIRRYLEQAGADVIAFQEVENLRAAHRVFSAADYDIHISERPTLEFPTCYDTDQRRLMQRTGFAVRRDITARLGLEAHRLPDLRALQGSYRSGRWGVQLVLKPVAAGAGSVPPLHLLSIHLKSRCTYQSMTGAKAGSHCHILRGQGEALSDWINARTRRRQDFIILGDFNRQLDQLSDELWLRLESGDRTVTHVDLEKALHGVKHPRPYNPKYPFAIDHVIYNQALDGLAVEQDTFFDVPGGRYSDHLPLFTVLDLSPTGGSH